MLTVNRLREYTAEMQAAITEINKAHVVVTSDELAKFMKDLKQSENFLLLALLPNHEMVGSEDNSKVNNVLGFYIWEKTDHSSQKHDDYLDSFSNTQEAAKKVVEKLLDDKANHTGALCNFLNRLKESSIDIMPRKGVHQCQGYYIGFHFETNF